MKGKHPFLLSSRNDKGRKISLEKKCSAGEGEIYGKDYMKSDCFTFVVLLFL